QVQREVEGARNELASSRLLQLFKTFFRTCVLAE
ncbi:MAG: hypothetical protein ACI92C_002731, partial [Neolewinella sp.]